MAPYIARVGGGRCKSNFSCGNYCRQGLPYCRGISFTVVFSFVWGGTSHSKPTNILPELGVSYFVLGWADQVFSRKFKLLSTTTFKLSPSFLSSIVFNSGKSLTAAGVHIFHRSKIFFSADSIPDRLVGLRFLLCVPRHL